MARAVVTFFKCTQDSPEFGSNNELMVSRVFFRLEIEGRAAINLHADIKQMVGSDFESGPIEISRQPHRERGLWGIRWPRWLLGYTGPFNFSAFRDCAEKYYRSLVGAQDSSIQNDSEDELDEMVLNGKADGVVFDVHRVKNIRMRGNAHQREMKCEFEIDRSAHGWYGHSARTNSEQEKELNELRQRVSSIPEIVNSLENAEKALHRATSLLSQISRV